MSGLLVHLTPSEATDAYASGLKRYAHHMERQGRKLTAKGAELQGIATMAECAVAKAFNGHWRPEVGEQHYGSADAVTSCGETLEVKATAYPHGKLFVYSDTQDELPVVLCIVDRAARTVRLVGWIKAEDAKRPEFFNPDLIRPCYELRQSQLLPVEDLPCFPPPVSCSPSPDSATTATMSESAVKRALAWAAQHSTDGQPPAQRE